MDVALCSVPTTVSDAPAAALAGVWSPPWWLLSVPLERSVPLVLLRAAAAEAAAAARMGTWDPVEPPPGVPETPLPRAMSPAARRLATM